MAKKKSICKNVDGCSKARNREIQEMDESLFQCDECGEPLIPYDDPDPYEKYDTDDDSDNGSGANAILVIIVILIVIAIICFFAFERREYGEEGLDGIQNTEFVGETPAAVQTYNAGVLQYPYGTYVGEYNDGYPDGLGRMEYREQRRIERRERREMRDSLEYTAQPGQFIIGRWDRGRLRDGYLFSREGNLVQRYDWDVETGGQIPAYAGTVNMPYGVYTGGLIDGYPDGEGRMVYRIRQRIAERDSLRFADPDQYIIGRWRRGELMQGNLYDASGNRLYGFNWW